MTVIETEIGGTVAAIVMKGETETVTVACRGLSRGLGDTEAEREREREREDCRAGRAHRVGQGGQGSRRHLRPSMVVWGAKGGDFSRFSRDIYRYCRD